MNKMTMPAQLRLISLILLAVTVTGCVGTRKEAILPQTGPTMKEVYDRHFQGGGKGWQEVGATESSLREPVPPMGKARRFGDGVTDLKGYTRESYNETTLVFSRLPNPDLVMYVFPHLSGPEGSPIPGYTTAFPFYETVQYALPGEVEGE